MANISNLKNNERWKKLWNERVTKIENENWADSGEMYLYQKANMRISKIATNAGYRIDKQFQNLLIFGISIVLQIEKILKIC